MTASALFSFSISVYCCGLSTEFLIKLFDDDDDDDDAFYLFAIRGLFTVRHFSQHPPVHEQLNSL